MNNDDLNQKLLTVNPPVPGPTNTVPETPLKTAVLKALETPDSEGAVEARKIHNMAVEGERAKYKKQADRWDTPVKVEVPAKLFDTLGPGLTALWKVEVPYEKQISDRVKLRNIELQAQLNRDADFANAQNKYINVPPHGLYLVRYDTGREVECYKIDAKSDIVKEIEQDLARLTAKPTFWTKVKSFFKRGQP